MDKCCFSHTYSSTTIYPEEFKKVEYSFDNPIKSTFKRKFQNVFQNRKTQIAQCYRKILSLNYDKINRRGEFTIKNQRDLLEIQKRNKNVKECKIYIKNETKVLEQDLSSGNQDFYTRRCEYIQHVKEELKELNDTRKSFMDIVENRMQNRREDYRVKNDLDNAAVMLFEYQIECLEGGKFWNRVRKVFGLPSSINMSFSL